MSSKLRDMPTFHSGSLLLQPLAESIGFPLDQINFICCQVFALLFGIVFRTSFGPRRTSPTTRHAIEIILGLCLTYFCFGSQVKYLLCQSLLCWLLLKFIANSEHLVFCTSIGTLCIGHLYRTIYDYGGYTIDITGPLMINTQRLSSLAYGLADGRKRKDKLSANMQKHAIKQFPTLLEFWSFVLSFHNVLCGPFAFYNDYLYFINGKNIIESGQKGQDYPGIRKAMLLKIAVAICAAVSSVLFSPHFPIAYLAHRDFFKQTFLAQLIFVIICTSVARHKYYFAWSLSEATNMSAGLGFDKDHKDGSLIKNADVWQVETCGSLKVLLDSWNVTTSLWLRHVVYERVGFLKTGSVFVFSALWHGFYPGYYLTFLTGIVISEAARLIRRNVRPLFLGSALLKTFYDFVTFTATRIGLGYLTFPFVLLNWGESVDVLKNWWFFLHLLSAGTILYFHFMKK